MAFTSKPYLTRWGCCIHQSECCLGFKWFHFPTIGEHLLDNTAKFAFFCFQWFTFNPLRFSSTYNLCANKEYSLMMFCSFKLPKSKKKHEKDTIIIRCDSYFEWCLSAAAPMTSLVMPWREISSWSPLATSSFSIISFSQLTYEGNVAAIYHLIYICIHCILLCCWAV